MRQFTNDPLIIMPSSQDSFTNDESGQPHLSDWRSKLSGAFSGGSQQDTLDSHIRSILVPRISGTQGNVEVREVSFIAEVFLPMNISLQIIQSFH